jgi:hypothetical protein
MTKGLLISRRKKYALSKKCVVEPSQCNTNTFKTYRNVYNKAIRCAKKLYFEKQLQINKSNLKKTWKILKEAVNKKVQKSSSVDCIVVNGVELTNPSLIAETLNNFFITAASDVVGNIPYADPPVVPPLNDDIPLLSFTNSPVTHSEILDVIKSLQSKNSTDFNGLSASLIKQISYQIANPLKHIINLSLSSSIVPTQLKIAKVIPVFKSGDRRSMDNYRPISLLSIFSKILEKVVCNRLCSFLETNNILSGAQFGFRPGHSTVHPMVHFVNHVSKALNNKEHSIAIFCDLRKAFDSCDHEILLRKLSGVGIRGDTLAWFRNYLSNRQQFVTISGHNSSLKLIKLGVPQGSILGPILFLLYINDLPQSSLLYDLLFADDTTLYASGPDLPDLISFVNTEFQKICLYFRQNKLALHPAKTQFALFSNSRDARDSVITIFANNNNPGNNDPTLCTPLERIHSSSQLPAIKFLGVYFDTDLNFKHHVKTICTRVSRALYMLRTCKNFLSANSLKPLYYSLVHCHLVYGNHIWGCANSSVLTELFRKQKAAVRLISNSGYRAHTEPIFKSLNILRTPIIN